MSSRLHIPDIGHTNPGNDLLYPLLMTLHVKKSLDLAECEILSVAQRDQLVKCTEQLERIAKNLPFVQALAYAAYYLCEKMQGVDVLQDIRLAIRDEDHVQLVQRLIDEANVVLLDSRVLRPRIGQLWERSQQSLNPGSLHLSKLPRKDSLAASRTY